MPELTNEQMWAGSFGSAYHLRNGFNDRREYWQNIMDRVAIKPDSIIELGAGKGENLAALCALGVGAKWVGIEVNKDAASQGVPLLGGANGECCGVEMQNMSLYDIPSLSGFDMVIVRGVLIHIPQAYLYHVLGLLGSVKQTIVMIEYCDTERRHIPYRGEDGMLWADNYASKFLEAQPDGWADGWDRVCFTPKGSGMEHDGTMINVFTRLSSVRVWDGGGKGE